MSIAVEMSHTIRAQDSSIKDAVKPKYWTGQSEIENYELKQVHAVLERFGYTNTTSETNWDIFWAQGYYPFSIVATKAKEALKRNQKINHIDGIGIITCKHLFATRKVSGNIPKAFILPDDKNQFWKYASKHKEAVFVEKNNDHRGVILKSVNDVDLGGKKFVQEFIQNPFLVDNYKFDIGVFVAITSVNPIRMYYYNGDVFLRFCPEEYYPFDPLNVNKYVVAGNYRQAWQVPVLAQMLKMGYSMKNSLNFYLRSQGKDPRKVWVEVFNVIRDNLVNKAQQIKSMRDYAYPSNFFDMIRVDLILDVNMKVHLIEANFKPRLVSQHVPLQLLNDQVLFSLFSLVGLDSPFRNYYESFTQMKCRKKSTNKKYTTCLKNKAGAAMLATNKNIAVWATECVNLCKKRCDGICSVCLHCLTINDRMDLIEAYREHLRQGDFRRLFPPPMTPKSLKSSMRALNNLTPDLTRNNRLIYLWYQGKCNADEAWCN